jgi:hypothetical protein
MKIKILMLLSATILFTGCSTERITCWNETTGQINYMGGFDHETGNNYIVDVADDVRDFYSKKNCQRLRDV